MAAKPLPEVTRARERRTWELRVTQFKTEQQIADILNIDVSTVCRMLKRLEVRLAGEFAERAARIKAEQTGQLQHIAQEAMQGWERSQQDAEIERTVKTPQGTTTTVERRGQAGDPRYLDQARGAMEDIRDIWGLESPKEQKITGDSDQPVIVKVLRGVSMDDL